MRDLATPWQRLVDNLQRGDWWAKAALSPRERVRLYRKLASLARVGMPLPRALDALWQVASAGGKKPQRPLAVVIADWRKKVYDGHSFGAALAAWVPNREWMIVEAGSANLDQALDDAAALIDTSRQVTAAVVNAVTYPSFLSLLLTILMWIFSVEAIPAFAQVKPMDQWTGLAASMAMLSSIVRTGLLPMVAVSVVGLALAWWSLPRWTGEWRARFDVAPPWSFYRLVMGSSFLTSLVAFLRAGMPMPEALRRMRGTASPWMRERLDASLFYLNSGYDLGEALHLAGHAFPAPEIVEDLRIYAALGNLDDALKRISAEWVKQSIETLTSMGDTLKVVGMIMIAATIGWIQLGIIAVQQQLASGF